jgi:hypothetical protein
MVLAFTHEKPRVTCLRRRLYFDIVFRPDSVPPLMHALIRGQVPFIDQEASQLSFHICVHNVCGFRAFPRLHIAVLLMHRDFVANSTLPVVATEVRQVKL